MLSKAAAAIIPSGPEIRLRTAIAADETFMRRMFKTSRAGDFAAAGLPPAALDMLLEQQFRAQSAGYKAQFPDAVSLIILRHDEPIGRLMLSIGDRRWRIVDIILLPSARGCGIGTDIIGAVALAARAQGVLELVLSVLSTSVAARRLYLRLGFTETGEGVVHIEMTKPLVA